MAETIFEKPLDHDVSALSTSVTNLSNSIGTVPSGNTVEEQISALNSKITNVETATVFTGVSSLDVLKSELQTLANSMNVDHNKLVRFYSNFTSSGFNANLRFKGYLMVYQKNGSTATHYEILFEGENGHNVSVGYRDGTWTVEELALNSIMTKRFTKTSTGDNRNGVLHAWMSDGIRSALAISEMACMVGIFQGNTYYGIIVKVTDNIMMGHMFIPNYGGGFYFRDNSTDSTATSTDFTL